MAYKIRNYCLGCHYCALECPVEAIHYKGTKYEIDPEKCIECGLCVKLCNVDAIDTGVEPVVESHDPVEKDADIVIIGCGAGGSIAAVRAAQLTGGKVVVLEKAKKPGGSGWFAGFGLQLGEGGGGPGGPGGPGPGGPEGGPGAGPGGPGGAPGGPGGGEPDAMMAQMMKRDRSFIEKLDPELVANANASVKDVSNWLAEFEDIKNNLVEVEQFGRKSISLPSDSVRLLFNLKNHDNAIGPGRSGSFIIHTMLQQFEKYGIELLTQHKAVSLVKDENGNCCGVIAEDPGGVVKVNCKAVICLSGGFAHNDELLKKYTPWFFADNDPTAEPVHRFAAPTCTGDVIGIGESIGAYIDHESMYVNLFGPVHHPFSFSLFKACLEGENVVVNLDGKRFFNEGRFQDGAKPITSQRGRISYGIFNEANLMTALHRLEKGNEGTSIAHYPQDIADELADNNVSLYKADTLEELAEKAGINKEAFLETIARYNGYCKTGVDEEFGKDARYLKDLENGPYYAIFGKMATDGAFGGMLVNPKAEVYNADKSGVIPGLYAAGDCAAGLAMANDGPGDDRKKAVGDMSWAVGGGFMAATNAAEYVKNL